MYTIQLWAFKYISDTKSQIDIHTKQFKTKKRPMSTRDKMVFDSITIAFVIHPL